MGAAFGLATVAVVGIAVGVLAGGGTAAWSVAVAMGAAVMNTSSHLLRKRAGSPAAVSGREFRRRLPIVFGFLGLIIGATVAWNLLLGHSGRLAAIGTAVVLGLLMLAIIFRTQPQEGK